VSQTRHEPVAGRRVLLPVGSLGVEQYAAMQVTAPGPDLFEHLDQLEDVLTAGWRVPLSTWRLVDGSTALELIDQLRLSVSEQVQAAQQLLQRRDQVLASAHAEGDAMLAAARRQVRQRLADRPLEQVAAQRAAQIEQDAWRAAEAIERRADQDAVDSLRWLRTQLDALDQVLAPQLPSSEQVPEEAGSSEPEQFTADSKDGRSGADQRVRITGGHRAA
jgi:predicted nucleic acid-binding protein